MKNGQLNLPNHIVMSTLMKDSLTIGDNVFVMNTSRVDKWLHKKNGLIVHYSGPGVISTKPRCVAAVPRGSPALVFNVSLRPCNASDSFQQWTFGTYTADYEKLAKGELRLDGHEQVLNDVSRFIRS